MNKLACTVLFCQGRTGNFQNFNLGGKKGLGYLIIGLWKVSLIAVQQLFQFEQMNFLVREIFVG